MTNNQNQGSSNGGNYAGNLNEQRYTAREWRQLIMDMGLGIFPLSASQWSQQGDVERFSSSRQPGTFPGYETQSGEAISTKLSTQEFAKAAGVPVKTLQNDLARRRIQGAEKVEGQWRIPAAALDSYKHVGAHA